jgi:hypothetical protein
MIFEIVSPKIWAKILASFLIKLLLDFAMCDHNIGF